MYRMHAFTEDELIRHRAMLEIINKTVDYEFYLIPLDHMISEPDEQ